MVCCIIYYYGKGNKNASKTTKIVADSLEIDLHHH